MIIKNNEEYFRNIKSEKVINRSEINDIIFQLENELQTSAKNGYPGIGLAAPQIGIAKNIAIVRIDNFSLNLINSELITGKNQQMFRDEGCLSFPGKIENTLRYNEVSLKNDDEVIKLTGLSAVVAQHEIGHWNGEIFYDFKAPKLQPIISSKILPNSMCICGSGKKYKKCCF